MMLVCLVVLVFSWLFHYVLTDLNWGEDGRWRMEDSPHPASGHLLPRAGEGRAGSGMAGDSFSRGTGEGGPRSGSDEGDAVRLTLIDIRPSASFFRTREIT